MINNQQLRALHLWFTLVSADLNEKGLTVKKALKPSFDTDWSKSLFKELVWHELQKSLVGTTSTRDLETHDMNKLIDIITKHGGEKWGGVPDFPTDQQLLNYEMADKLEKECKKIFNNK